MIDADGAEAARVVGQLNASTLIALVEGASTDPSRPEAPDQ